MKGQVGPGEPSSARREERPLDAATLARKADLFRALSAPARVALVELLYAGPRSVNELLEALAGVDVGCSVERTNISKHLSVLRDAGIVSREEEGPRRIYRLEKPCLAEALDCCAGPGWKPAPRYRSGS